MKADDRPSFTTLCDWLEGRLDPEVAAVVAAAVEADNDGRLHGDVEWLQGFLGVSREMRVAVPPLIVRQRLNQHFGRWSKARAAMAETPLVVPADLLFDSRKDLVGSGVRGGTDDVVHLGFTSEIADVVLDATPEPNGRLRIDGQVLPTSATAPVFSATIESPTFEATVHDGDEFGHFTVRGVPREPLALQVSNGEITLVLRADLTEAS